MKKLFVSLAVVAVAVTACQKEVDMQKETDVSNTSSNVISIEEACENLNEILRCIDPQTRGTIRAIREITPLPCDSYLNSTTRTTSMESSELLYLVNFEDNNGYAVLAANTQISPSVLFITDSGSAEISDFEIIRTIDDANGLSLDDLYYAPEDDYYLGAVDMENSDLLLQQTIINNVVNFRNDVSTDQWDDDMYVPIAGKIQGTELPLTTKWKQKHPFNMKFPAKNDGSGERESAGCTTVAVGQLLTYLKSVDLDKEFNIENCTWNDIESFSPYSNDTYDTEETFEYDEFYCRTRDGVASLIKGVADGIEVKYGVGGKNNGGTYGRPKKVVRYLKELNFEVNHLVNLFSFNENTQQTINESLYNGYPVIVGALGSCEGMWNGHAWLITGCKYVVKDNDWLYQCNFGWGGYGNGWYMSNCFDSTEQVDVEKSCSSQDFSVRPLAKDGQFRFTWMFNIITVE